MKRLCYISLCILVVVLLDAIECSETDDEPMDQQQHVPYNTLVDQLIKDYLAAEKNLWEVIEKREDSTLQQIYNIHTDFLNRHYGESNVLLSGVYMDTVNPKLINNIISINETSHDIAREFFEHRNYTVLSMKALDGINLEKTFQSVCEQTINSNGFWGQLKNMTQDCQSSSSSSSSSRSVQSEYQVLHEYYKDIQAASLRTYITAQLSYMILHLHESGDYRNQSLAYQERFHQINAEIQSVFKSKLQQSNRDVWACDAIDNDAPAASYEITNFLQGYIDAEINLNAEGSCALTCGDYQNTKHYACNSDTLCAGLKPENRSLIGCKGRVRGCHGIDDSISVCPAEDNNHGRYKYVKSLTGLRLGNVSTCANELQANAWVRWFVKCSNCFCYCDDNKNSDRYFSLREVVSDIHQNQIVTGIALTKRNSVVQFVIAQRQLTAFGNVDRSHVEYAWTLAEQFVPNHNESQDGVDFHTLTYENRSLNLDTVIAPTGGHIVTGVRFGKSEKGHLRLEVRFTEFDDITGKLNNFEKSVWLWNANGGKHRINTDNLGIPLKIMKSSQPNIKENSYVRFGPTHKKADLSQRTVPFIDGQKVEPKIPSPLSGIGLYYGSGGFIAPKIVIASFE